MIWIPLGFAALLLYAFWLAARVAQRRRSALAGMIAGAIAAPLLWGIYLVALAHWARAELRDFLQTKLPLITEHAALALDQIRLLGERLQ